MHTVFNLGVLNRRFLDDTFDGNLMKNIYETYFCCKYK